MPEERDYIGGLSGAELTVDGFDLGKGICLTQTYAHLMAPLMMAFDRPEPGKHHPPPWLAAQGGFGFDITIQLFVPRSLDVPELFGYMNVLMEMVVLLRLRAAPHLLLSVISDEPFANAVNVGHSVRLWPREVEPIHNFVVEEPSRTVDVTDLEWIRDHWQTCRKLLRSESAFELLVQAFDGCRFVRVPQLALLFLWGALENMFSPAKVELRFRISANIASFLERPSKTRLDLHKKLLKLYDARSNAAHGGDKSSLEGLRETYQLVRRIITKIIEDNRVPKIDEMESRLFGATTD